MPINYQTYKTKIIEASKAARQASSINDALEIQAQGYADALQAAIGQAVVNTLDDNGDKGTGTVS